MVCIFLSTFLRQQPLESSTEVNDGQSTYFQQPPTIILCYSALCQQRWQGAKTALWQEWQGAKMALWQKNTEIYVTYRLPAKCRLRI